MWLNAGCPIITGHTPWLNRRITAYMYGWLWSFHFLLSKYYVRISWHERCMSAHCCSAIRKIVLADIRPTGSGRWRGSLLEGSSASRRTAVAAEPCDATRWLISSVYEHTKHTLLLTMSPWVLNGRGMCSLRRAISANTKPKPWTISPNINNNNNNNNNTTIYKAPYHVRVTTRAP